MPCLCGSPLIGHGHHGGQYGLVSFISHRLVVLEDLYDYFHLSNIGEWKLMFEHFPGHRTADTSMLRMQEEMMDKWFHNGLGTSRRLPHSLREPLGG